MSLVARLRSLLRLKDKGGRDDLISVVLLLHQPISLTDEVLHNSIEKAWGRGVRKELNGLVSNTPPQRSRKHIAAFRNLSVRFEAAALNGPATVKSLLRVGDRGEWMWVEVSLIEGDTIRGTVMNSPVDVGNIRQGDVIGVSVAEIGDWCYTKGWRKIGDFTSAALMKK